MNLARKPKFSFAIKAVQKFEDSAGVLHPTKEAAIAAEASRQAGNIYANLSSVLAELTGTESDSVLELLKNLKPAKVSALLEEVATCANTLGNILPATKATKKVARKVAKPVEGLESPPRQRRKRRTKAEMEADRAAAEGAPAVTPVAVPAPPPTPTPPPSPAKVTRLAPPPPPTKPPVDQDEGEDYEEEEDDYGALNV